MSKTKCDDVYLNFGKVDKKNKPPVIYKSLDKLEVYLSGIYVLQINEDLFRFQVIYADDKVYAGFIKLQQTAGNWLKLYTFLKWDTDPMEMYKKIFKDFLFDGCELMYFDNNKEFFEYANNFYNKEVQEND